MDNSGQPLYCTCLRNLFRGISRRHDVRRRPMHALCFVSRYPYLQLFRSLLFQLFGFGLVEQHAGSVRTFLDIIYTQALSNINSGGRQEYESIAVARALLPEFLHDYTVSAPVRPQVTASLNPGAGTGGTGPIVFLLESLGVEKSLIVLSAVLCEKRVIFLADEVGHVLYTTFLLSSYLSLFHSSRLGHDTVLFFSRWADPLVVSSGPLVDFLCAGGLGADAAVPVCPHFRPFAAHAFPHTRSPQDTICVRRATIPRFTISSYRIWRCGGGGCGQG